MHYGGPPGQQCPARIEPARKLAPTLAPGMASDVGASSKAISGMRIAVTAADLEQLEHRGIAAYSRNLLKALAAGGAEVWLITEFDPKLRLPGFKRLPRATRDLLQAAKILDDLCAGHSAPEMGSYGMEMALSPGVKRIHQIGKKIQHKLWAWFSPYIPLQFIKRDYSEETMPAVLIHEHRDNPYLRHQRLDYLDGVTGILCAPKFFGKANWLASRMAGRGVRLKLRSFQALITTCPINLCEDGRTPVIQTIHDIIPIEFARHGESPVAFTRRLQAAHEQNRIFMSQASREKYNYYIGKGHNKDSVIIQPPSLQIEQEFELSRTNHDESASESNSGWSWLPTELLFENKESKNAKNVKNKLRTLRYFLFNSSIEPRKNTIFLVKAFLESNLAEKGYNLCITGSLKQDSYSHALRQMVGKNPHILLTGYVNEPTKLELFSHALALVSPSLVEGFGIPLLDAACMGMPAIASESDSHLEIRNMHDFNQFITLVRTIKTTPWACLMQKLAESHEWLTLSETEDIVNQRLSRYTLMQRQIEHEFRKNVYHAINSACQKATIGASSN